MGRPLHRLDQQLADYSIDFLSLRIGQLMPGQRFHERISSIFDGTLN
jgi:hypothetical protein